MYVPVHWWLMLRMKDFGVSYPENVSYCQEFLILLSWISYLIMNFLSSYLNSEIVLRDQEAWKVQKHTSILLVIISDSYSEGKLTNYFSS